MRRGPSAFVVLAVVTSALVVLLLGELALRVPFPCDLAMWSESPFMTDMLKVANGRGIYADPLDVNSFIYSPGLVYLTSTILGPFGLCLDVRFCRVVTIGLGLAAAATGGVFVRAVSEKVGGDGQRSLGLGAACSVALVLFRSITADVPHPDNLSIFVAVTTLTLCHRATERGHTATAVAAFVLAGAAALTKQTAGGMLFGAVVAVMASRRWPIRRTLWLALPGFAMFVLSVSLLLGPDNARFFTWTVPAAHDLSLERLGGGLLPIIFRPYRVLLFATAPAWILLLRREPLSRGLLTSWTAVGVCGVLPSALSLFKEMGADNNLAIIDVWLALLPWSALAVAHGRAQKLTLAGIVALLSATVPLKQPFPASALSYCDRMVSSVGADLRDGRQVLLGHGTTPLIRAGTTAVPRDREYTVLEITAARRNDVLVQMQARWRSRVYDRIYVIYPGLMLSEAERRILATEYRQVGHLPGVPFQSRFGLDFRPESDTWVFYMPEVLVYAPR